MNNCSLEKHSNFILFHQCLFQSYFTYCSLIFLNKYLFIRPSHIIIYDFIIIILFLFNYIMCFHFIILYSYHMSLLNYLH